MYFVGSLKVVAEGLILICKWSAFNCHYIASLHMIWFSNHYICSSKTLRQTADRNYQILPFSNDQTRCFNKIFNLGYYCVRLTKSVSFQLENCFFWKQLNPAVLLVVTRTKNHIELIWYHLLLSKLNPLITAILFSSFDSVFERCFGSSISLQTSYIWIEFLFRSSLDRISIFFKQFIFREQRH